MLPWLVYHRFMGDAFFDRALLRWDGIHLVLDIGAMELKVGQAIRSQEMISDIAVGGWADVLQLNATIHWKGMSSRVRLEIREIRLRSRRLGFRLGKLKVLQGVRVPRRLIENLLEKYGRGKLRVLPGHGIVVVDLREYLPPELDLRLLTLQVSGRKLHLWLGPGALLDLPARGGLGERPRLEARKMLETPDSDAVDT